MSTPESEESSRAGQPIIAVFTSHWLAMLGLGLVLTAIVAWACLLPAQLRNGGENPYVGVATVAVGAVFAAGLLITPLGLFLARRRLRGRLAEMMDRRTAWSRLLGFLAVTSLVNLLIASQLTLRAVHHMESRQFCTSCHVHLPYERTFDQGSHAGILCVDCHVGDGALGLVKSKLQGTQQLMAVLTDSVHLPIEGAIERGLMIPSDETCEDCHWKERPAGARLKLIQRYAEDEENTPQTTLLTMNIGGRVMGGIHGAHHGDGIEIRFVAKDAARQDIPLVEYENAATGESRVYTRKGVAASELEGAERIKMQCFDCHNRPAHSFELPEQAVDRAITLGRMSASLPFLKKKAVEILRAEYADSATAALEIPRALEAYYRSEHATVARDRDDDVEKAAATLADIYSRNVFPEFKLAWGTYPDNRGHQGAPGCFRCHGGEHETPSGEKLTNNCFRCHFPAAVDETSPEVLALLGVDKLLKGLQKKATTTK